MVKEKVQYWVDLSDYDLETADAMLQSKRYLYVGFMCHQAVEKMLKGYFAYKTDEIPPFTHNLAYLIARTELDSILNDEHKSLIDELEPMNIEARYPEYKERLLKTLSEKKCESLLAKTVELLSWIRLRLS